MFIRKTYTGDFTTGKGQSKVFGPRFNEFANARGYIYYELWEDKIKEYSGATDQLRPRLHGLMAEGKIYRINKIVVVTHDNARDRDNMEVSEQISDLPPRNKRPQRKGQPWNSNHVDWKAAYNG
jgi:hypothetical protein